MKTAKASYGAVLCKRVTQTNGDNCVSNALSGNIGTQVTTFKAKE